MTLTNRIFAILALTLIMACQQARAVPGYHINSDALAQRAVRQFAESPDNFAACVYQAVLDKAEWKLTLAAYAYYQLKPGDPNRECSFAQAYWETQRAGLVEEAPQIDPQQSLKMQTDAVNCVVGAAKKLPNSYTAHLNYGEYIEYHLMPSMDHSQIRPMIREYRRAVALRPDLGETHYHLGDGYCYPLPPALSNASEDMAIGEFTKAVALDPRLKDSYFRICCIYAWPPKLDYATAQRYLNKFLAVAPEEATRIDVAKARADLEKKLEAAGEPKH